MNAKVQRDEQIAAIHDLADWLAANPDVPMPSLNLFRHLHYTDGTDAECLDLVRNLATGIGVVADEHLDDRTVLRYRVNRHVWYELFAWHKAGRGAIDEVDRLRARIAELEARGPHVAEPQPLADPTGDSYSDLADRLTIDVAPVPDDVRGLAKDDTGEFGVVHPATSGLVDETPTEPVTVYFSFGHGQSDPDTGKDLLDHYVTIVGPSYEACRAAMFNSRFGQAWSFDYLAGTPQADEWIPRWTEHERIDAMPKPVDETGGYWPPTSAD